MRRPPFINRPEPINWRGIILSILEAGYSLRGIAAAINVDESLVRHWFNQHWLPSYENGVALLLLHQKIRPLCGELSAKSQESHCI